MTIEGPARPLIPRHLVLAFMAGLSLAARLSAECYLLELIAELAMWRRSEGDA